MELLFPLILVVYAKYTTEKAFDLMASHGISICYTMPSRDLCKIHEGMFDKPEGVARGFITHSRVFLHRSLEGMV